MAVPTRPVAGAPIESAWGDVVHDAAVAVDIQAAPTDVTLVNQANNDKAIVFPRPFASPPVVVVSGDTTIHGSMVAKVTMATITATGFTIRVGTVDGLAHGAGTMRCTWVAIGPRA